jgi:tRNA modification GTPase
MTPATICAVATPPGRGGVGVIRLSGPKAQSIAEHVVGELPAPRYASLRVFRDQGQAAIDEGLVLFFPGPGSMTGEDVVEFQGHGGPIVLDRLLQQLLALGAELAAPGEFSQRAFLNGRLDLTRAEAIADLIEAGSEAAAQAAMRSLQGEFARRIAVLIEALTELRVHLESSLDFSDEPLDGLALDQVSKRIGELSESLAETCQAASEGQQLQEGLTVVIAGRPNAGKSSLLNALTGRDAAIVTSLAGTTRDVLDSHLHLEGLPLRVLDTAGLRVGGDVVEQEGVKRAQAAMAEADRILWVAEDNHEHDDFHAALPANVPITRVINKIDLSGRSPGIVDDVVAVSALTGEGLPALRAYLRGSMAAKPSETIFTARRRHLVALDAAAEALTEAQQAAVSGLGEELMAESLREAQSQLGEITGAVSTEDLLGRIFSTFCIGK